MIYNLESIYMRKSGILLHPTSLPGRFGIGEFDHHARAFVDFLAESGQKLWQVMPLGPTGYGDSPYQCFSAFAGNPLLISLEQLVAEGSLDASWIENPPVFPSNKVDYGWVIDWKFKVLRASYEKFATNARAHERGELAKFVDENASWLNDYSLFMALKELHGGKVWTTWEPDIARHESAAWVAWRATLHDQVAYQQYLQFQFFKQWHALKKYANDQGIQVIGDIPIFVAFDSSDAWSTREQFYFDETLQPTVVAGVPPDYFSATGQRWGNPLYRWDVMQARGFDWWIARLRASLATYDVIRVDHFRGFEAYWEVPASEPTATHGRWVKAPGYGLFERIMETLAPKDTNGKSAKLPMIAEDLGVITAEVEALRDRFELPGMRVLQFAFVADTASDFLPHNYVRNCVAYSGTHDNDTTASWFTALDEATRTRVEDYLGKKSSGKAISMDMARLLMMSCADTVVLTLQDLLGLGTDARMNFPGKGDGNWAWRYGEGVLTEKLAAGLKRMTETYGR